ncbi:MAG: PRC-barrel domain-containing protein [Paracoccaceae bacterium]
MDHSQHAVLNAVDFVPDTLVDAVVYDGNDDKIGSVSHVHGMGTSSQVVVEVGGFLGLGAKAVVVPIKELTFMRDDDGEVLAVTGLTMDQVKALPEHKDRP